MNTLHARIERLTGVYFGIHRRDPNSPPEFLGAFYLRLGRTKANLVPVELGFGSRFFWMEWMKR